MQRCPEWNKKAGYLNRVSLGYKFDYEEQLVIWTGVSYSTD
jgi:hypothetical protein